MTTRIRWILAATVLLAASALGISGQDVDTTYAPGAHKEAFINSAVYLPLSGGKLLAAIRYNITSPFDPPLTTVRKINADGTLDSSFNCPTCNFGVAGLALDPSGKYLVAGNGHLIRLNSDGSADPTFTSGLPAGTPASVYAVLPDGRVYASGLSGNTLTLYRLNSDGSIDGTFTATVFTPFSLPNGSFINGVIVQGDGKLLVFGNHQTFGRLFRLNSDGTRDTGWSSPILVNATDSINPPRVSDVAVQADGKVVFVGAFTSVNGVTRGFVARLNPDSSVDSAFVNLPFGAPAAPTMRVQADGKFIIHSTFFQDCHSFKRLNPDLSFDAGFVSPCHDQNGWTINSNDEVTYVHSDEMFRLTTTGSNDTSFDFDLPVLSDVTAVAVQADGRAIVAGAFKFLNGVLHPSIGRLNTDGSLDASYVTGAGFMNFGNRVALTRALIQPTDGKMIAYGAFTAYNGQSRTTLARLNTDGTLDTPYQPKATGIVNIAMQPDGKLLLLGSNIAVNGFARTGVARLNTDGTLDTAFNPLISGSSFAVRSAVVRADGKIVIGGTFTTIDGVNRSNLARLNANGSLDASFDAGAAAVVKKVVAQADGKLLVAFNTQVLRKNADGSPDASFNPSATVGLVFDAMLAEAGGAILLGSVRLRPNGSRDFSFLPTGVDGPIKEFGLQPDGKIVMVGTFSRVDVYARASIARLNPSPDFTKTPFDFDGDGRADFAVTRPSDYYWHVLTSGTLTYTATQFGTSGDKVVPADYDGDGKTDIAIWRPSTGDWWYIPSSTGIITNRNIGNNGDTPMPSDTDGNGTADMVVVTPGLIWKGIDAASGNQIVLHQFGQAGDKPVVGDFDGDGKSDLAFFRPSEGKWYYNKSSSGANLEVGVIHWGLGTDIPVPADYDGDGTTDAAVFRPSEGNWYVLNSGGGMTMLHFGATGDKPVAADYDGDGKADIAVYRPSEGFWYLLLTTGGYTGLPWGISSDIPAPNALLPLPDPPRASSAIVSGTAKRK